MMVKFGYGFLIVSFFVQAVPCRAMDKPDPDWDSHQKGMYTVRDIMKDDAASGREPDPDKDVDKSFESSSDNATGSCKIS